MSLHQSAERIFYLDDEKLLKLLLRFLDSESAYRSTTWSPDTGIVTTEFVTILRFVRVRMTVELSKSHQHTLLRVTSEAPWWVIADVVGSYYRYMRQLLDGLVRQAQAEHFNVPIAGPIVYRENIHWSTLVVLLVAIIWLGTKLYEYLVAGSSPILWTPFAVSLTILVLALGKIVLRLRSERVASHPTQIDKY